MSSMLMFRRRRSRPATYLGLIEEVTGKMVGRHVMSSITNSSFVAESKTALMNQQPTQIYTYLSKFQLEPLYADLIFTDTDAWNHCKHIPTFEIKRVINLQTTRLGRTILEININGQPLMALKCIGNDKKSIINDAVVTPTQEEAMAFDNLPTVLKDIFPRKFAHGRMWIVKDSYKMNYELILMEKLCELDMNDTIEEHMKLGKFNEAYTWWAQCIKHLSKLHRYGYVHGDCKLDNFLWQTNVGGNIKMIDPERMSKLSNHDTVIQNLLKLGDIYHIIFHCSPYAEAASKEQAAFTFDFGKLFRRLSVIKSSLEGETKKSFLLDDVMIYHINMNAIAIMAVQSSQNFNSYLGGLRTANPNQYMRLSLPEVNSNIDLFLDKICNPQILQQTILYLIKQTKNMDSSYVDAYDKTSPLIVNAIQPNEQHIQPPISQPTVLKELTYLGYTLRFLNPPQSPPNLEPRKYFYTVSGRDVTCYKPDAVFTIYNEVKTSYQFMFIWTQNGTMQLFKNLSNGSTVISAINDTRFTPLMFYVVSTQMRVGPLMNDNQMPTFDTIQLQ